MERTDTLVTRTVRLSEGNLAKIARLAQERAKHANVPVNRDATLRMLIDQVDEHAFLAAITRQAA